MQYIPSEGCRRASLLRHAGRGRQEPPGIIRGLSVQHTSPHPANEFEVAMVAVQSFRVHSVVIIIALSKQLYNIVLLALESQQWNSLVPRQLVPPGDYSSRPSLLPLAVFCVLI